MVVGLANEMAETNDVTVCSVFRPPYDSIFYTGLSNKVKKVHLGVEKSGFSIRNVLRIYNYLRKQEFDIIHFHGLFYYFALSILLLHKRFKFIYTFHSDAYKESGPWDLRIIWIKRFFLKAKWMIPVTISPPSRDSFLSCYGLDSSLVLNGIPRPTVDTGSNFINSLRISPDTKVFLHPGRICNAKNQVVLCKVFQRLILKGYDIMLLIAGSNVDQGIFDELNTMFCDRIVYLGERNDVSQLLYESDGLCLPSIWEGLPMVLLESLSVGCVPICSPVGGIVSVIDSGRNGLLSKSSSEEDYYETMKTYLSLSDAQIAIMKKQCLDSFGPYDIVNTSANYIKYYKSLLYKTA